MDGLRPTTLFTTIIYDPEEDSVHGKRSYRDDLLFMKVVLTEKYVESAERAYKSWTLPKQHLFDDIQEVKHLPP